MKASPWYAALTPREQDLLTFVSHAEPMAKSADLSQSIGRHRSNLSDSVLGAILPKKMRWIFCRQRLLTGCECLGLQAFP